MSSKKLRVAIIGTNGLPGNYGGWDQLVNRITHNLKDDFNFTVYTSKYNAVPGLKTFNQAKLKIIPLKANGFQSVPYDIISILHASIFSDVLYICGTSGSIILPLIKIFRRRVIMNPDGQEWKRNKWSNGVKIFLKISERIGVKYSGLVVADNAVIRDYVRADYGKEAVLIEYGGDNVINVPLSESTKDKYDLVESGYAFKVCRIVPENNIDMILEAFKKAERLKLVVVGNWEFSSYGKELRNEYKDNANLLLLDPIYDQKALDELRSNCKIYLHGHSVGGTNPSLVEAMNLGHLY